MCCVWVQVLQIWLQCPPSAKGEGSAAVTLQRSGGWVASSSAVAALLLAALAACLQLWS